MPKLTDADVKAIIGMKPTDVLAYLRAKGFVISWAYQDVLGELHATMFTVAKVTKLDILQAISDALQTAVGQGQTFKQFQAELEPVLRKKGWWGKAIDPATGEITPAHSGTTAPAQLGSTRRLWTIYQTNMQSAFMAGRYKAMMAATDTHPYWVYRAIRDRRTRPSHGALDGRVYRYDDPIWNAGFYPPLDYNCRCRVGPMSAYTMEQQGLSLRDSAKEPIAIQSVTVGAGQNAKQTTQAVFKTLDSKKGRRVTVATAPGFAFNVGQAAWSPETNRWRGPVANLAQSLR